MEKQVQQIQLSSILDNFFLFVNDGSGGGLGQKIMKFQVLQDNTQVEHITLKIQDIKKSIKVYIFNMRQNREEGFKLLNKMSKEGLRVAAVVVGGDGTVMWVVNQFAAHNIDPMKVPIGIIPIGTGNDFSQQLGWGVQQSSLMENDLRQLKILIKQWINAKEQLFDLWDIHAQVYQNGFFEKVDKVNDRNVMLPEKTLKKTISNYFSFGMDGKIGYSFDRHRTQSRTKNFMMYGILGVIKSMTKTKSVKQLVESMQIRQDLSDEIAKEQKIVFLGLKEKGQEGSEFVSSFNKTYSLELRQSSIKKIQNQVLNKSSSGFLLAKQKIKEKKNSSLLTETMVKDYCNILALNINSFMGGVKDIWHHAQMNQPNEDTTPTSTFDGKIQIVSFGSTIGLAAERMFKGQSDRVCQGKGPFYFKFKEYPNQRKHRTYFQTDGQFYRVTHPKSVLIKYSDLIPGGKIKVLRKAQKPSQI